MGVYDNRMADLCLTQREIEEIYYEPGTAVDVYIPEKGKWDIKPGRVVDTYQHHILVRIDGVLGSYNMSIDKVDLKRKVDSNHSAYLIKEVS